MNSVTEFYRTLSNDLQKLIVDVNESKIDKLSTQAIIDSVDENNMIVDIIQEIDAESFPVILRYIYTGVADLSTLDAQEILAYHMKETKRKSTKLWPRLGKIDSEIIKSKQATSITNLIDNGKVIGGYNPLGWMKIDPKDKNDYSKSFLFSFDPNLDIRSMKCISVKTPIFAFNNQNQQALHFGTSDLIINGKTGTCIVKDFQNPIINTRNFNIDNIEVFAVRMK
ncbi:unnamed protein product [Rhizophagus irregularis]|uniref:TLDc domain-containing protein n=1 Tax=Rhizophagus irregularis TaxID=588596 RepID=A0A915Z8E1_9GLOM|nr:unnamed protein product [Rhizophagus irregularis]